MTSQEPGWLDGRITDQGIAALRARIGKMTEGPTDDLDPITRTRILHFMHGVGDDNPLWYDREYAAKSQWGGIIAPPTIVQSANYASSPGELYLPAQVTDDPMPNTFMMVSGGRTRWYRHVRPGDVISTANGLHDVIERKSRMGGRSVEVIHRTVYRDAAGETVAEAFGSVFRFERGAAREQRKYLDIPKAVYTDEEVAEMYREYETEVHQRRGNVTRWWEEVTVGEDLITILKGPLTVTNIIGYCIGWRAPMCFTNRMQHLWLKAHPQNRIVDPDTNIEDSIIAPHWDDFLAVRSGIPRGYDEGIMRVAWLGHLMTDWMGDDGFLHEVYVQLRAPNLIGDISRCSGRVTGKREESGQHLVDVDVWVQNQRGERTAIGTAIVGLPSRKDS